MTKVEVQTKHPSRGVWETVRTCRTVTSARDFRRRAVREGHPSSAIRVLHTVTTVLK